MGKVNTRLMLIVLGVLSGLCLVFLAAYLFLPDSTQVKDVLWSMQAGVTALAVILGGTFAAYKWQIYRESEPHLTITHEVSYRPVGESYVHIAVTAVLQNSSRVQIELREGFFLAQHLAPTSDEHVEELYAEVYMDEKFEDIQWPTLEELQRQWDKGELVVEPGETHPESIEFIISKSVESVILHTYFYNPKSSSDARAAEGWGRTSVLDMIRLKRVENDVGEANGS